MKRTMKKIVSILLALAMVITSINYTPTTTVKAATGTINADKYTAEVTDGKTTFNDNETAGGITYNNYVRYGASVVAVSGETETDACKKEYAIDNDKDSRWADSNSGDNGYITVDLGAAYSINKVYVNWETANAQEYGIQYSNDNNNFKAAAVIENTSGIATNGGDRIDKVTLKDEIKARYIKIQVTKRCTKSDGTNYGGVSIREIGIYGISAKAKDIVWSDNWSGCWGDWKYKFEDTETNGKDTYSNYVKYTNYRNVTATADGYSKEMTPSKAIDGSIDAPEGGTPSRWANESVTDGHYLTINLGMEYDIRKIGVSWEVAQAKIYNIETSVDGENFSTAATVNIDGHTDDKYGADKNRVDKITLSDNVKAQYIRIYTLERVNSGYGTSIWEVAIYGPNKEGVKTYSTEAFDGYKTALGNKIEAEAVSEDITKGALKYTAKVNLENTVSGSVAGYKVYFDRKTSKVQFRYSARYSNAAGKIKMYIDSPNETEGKLVATFETKATSTEQDDNWNTFVTGETSAEIPQGDHKIYLVFEPNQGKQYVANIDYFQFEYAPEEVSEKHEAENAHAYEVGGAEAPHSIARDGTAIGNMNTYAGKDPAYLTTYVQVPKAKVGNYQLKIDYATASDTKIKYRIDNGNWTELTAGNTNSDIQTLTSNKLLLLKEGIHKIDISGATDNDDPSNWKWVDIDCFTLEEIIDAKNAFNDRQTELIGNKIEAEDTAALSGGAKPDTDNKYGQSGTGNLGGTKNDSWAQYNVYFDRKAEKVNFQYSSNSNAVGNIEIYVDDIKDENLVGKIHTESNSGGEDNWDKYISLSGKLEKAIEQGTHKIYLKFVPDEGKSYVANIDYFQFEYVPQNVGDNINNEAENAHTYIQGSSPTPYAIQEFTGDDNYPSYSNGQAIRALQTKTGEERSYFTTYVNVPYAGDYTLTIGYATSSKNAHLDYSINGNGDGNDDSQWKTLITKATGEWRDIQKVKATVTLKKGINIIDITGAISDNGKDYLNIDYFKIGRDESNLAYNKKVTTSGTSQENLPAESAVDGKYDTRWAANKIDDGKYWYQVDLDGMYEIEEVKIFFENAYAKNFEIQISPDGNHWVTARTVRNFNDGNLLEGEHQTIVWSTPGEGEGDYVCLGKAKYIRIYATEMVKPDWGLSIYEFIVRGEKVEGISNLATGKDVKVTASSSNENPINQAVDGNLDTRWGSTNGNTQWYQVDLGEKKLLDTIDLRFERDYPQNFTVSILNDNGGWDEVYRGDGWNEHGNPKDINDKNKIIGCSIHVENVETRAVKIEATDLRAEGRFGGLSIWEFEVWGKDQNKDSYWENESKKTYGVYPISEEDYNRTTVVTPLSNATDEKPYGNIDQRLVQEDVLGTGDTYEVLYQENKEIYFFVNPRDLYLYYNSSTDVSWSDPERVAKLSATSGEQGVPVKAKYKLPSKEEFKKLLEEQKRDSYITTEITCTVQGFDRSNNQKTKSITFKLKVINSSLSINDTIMKDGCINVDTTLDYGISTNGTKGVTYEWQRSDDGITWTNVADKRYDLTIISDGGKTVNVAYDIGGGKYYRVRAVKEDDIGEWSYPYHIPYYNEVQNGGFEYPAMFSTEGKTDENKDVRFPFNGNGDEQQYPNGYKGMFWKTTGPACWNERNGMQIGHDIEIVNGRHLLVNQGGQEDQFSVKKDKMYNDDKSLKTHDHVTGENLDHGEQFAELNSENTGALYQDILTTPGSTCVWALDHAGRWNQNSMLVVAMSAKVATNNADKVDPDSILAAVHDYENKNGKIAANPDPEGSDKGHVITVDGLTFTVWRVTSRANEKGIWDCHSGTYEVSADKDVQGDPINYLTRFFFVSEVGGDREKKGNLENTDTTVGNLLDNVSFKTVMPYTIEYMVRESGTAEYTKVAEINNTVFPYDRVDIPLSNATIEANGGSVTNGKDLANYTLTKAEMEGMDNEYHLYDIQYEQSDKGKMTVASYHNHLIIYYDTAIVAVTKKIEGLNNLPDGYDIKFNLIDSNEKTIASKTLSRDEFTWVEADGDSPAGYLANITFDVSNASVTDGTQLKVTEELVPRVADTKYYLEEVEIDGIKKEVDASKYSDAGNSTISFAKDDFIYQQTGSNRVRFVNVYNATHTITVTKNVEGSFLEKYQISSPSIADIHDKDFEFTLNVKKGDASVDALKYDKEITKTATGDYTFKLQNGDSVNLEVLDGSTVSVNEKDYTADGYKTTEWTVSGINNGVAAEGRKLTINNVNADATLECTNIKTYYGDVEVQGFQMNTDTSEGGVSEFSPSFRVVSRACKELKGSDGELHKVVNYGTIYSLDDNVKADYDKNMRIDKATQVHNGDPEYRDEFTSTIYYFESQIGTYLNWTAREPEDPYYNYFALTIYWRSYSFKSLNEDMIFRAYAKLDNGDIVYGTKIYKASIYDIAKNLYDNTKLGTKQAHDFLYNNVLNLVDMDKNRVDICQSMMVALDIRSTGSSNYSKFYPMINTINHDINEYVYCLNGYKDSYPRTTDYSPIGLSSDEQGALLGALNTALNPQTGHKTLFDWIYYETPKQSLNGKNYKGFYKKVPYDWDNSIYKK